MLVMYLCDELFMVHDNCVLINVKLSCNYIHCCIINALMVLQMLLNALKILPTLDIDLLQLLEFGLPIHKNLYLMLQDSLIRLVM